MRTEYSCRLRDPSDFDPEGVYTGKFFSMYRTSRQYKKPYRVIIGRLKKNNKYADQAYRYKKEKWLFRESKKHCKDHGGLQFEEQYFNEMTGNPFQSEEDKLTEFLRLKRIGALKFISDLRFTENNVALFALELEKRLNDFRQKLAIKGYFFCGLGVDEERKQAYIRISYEGDDSPNQKHLISVFFGRFGVDKDRLGHGFPSSFMTTYLPTNYSERISFGSSDVMEIFHEIEDSPVPDEWYLGVDL